MEIKNAGILYKTAKTGNISYYRIDDRQPDIFSPWSLTVSWGKSPEGERKKNYVFETENHKDQKIRDILESKKKTYKILYSYFRKQCTKDESLDKSMTNFKFG
jgi:hypothetical protein